MDVKTKSNFEGIRHRPLIFLDLETTGLAVQKHEIIEIGALKVEPKKPFKILGEINLKVKPKKLNSADKDSLKLVGFSTLEWKDALSLEEALIILEEFGKEGVLAGYNVNFDWAVLDKAYYSLGKSDPFYYHRLDVMPMAYFKLHSKTSLKRFSLGEICKYLRIKREVEHRALADARVTYLVFKKLISS